ncbi:hypothetical protein Bca4012_089960 [Brassica carinata]
MELLFDPRRRCLKRRRASPEQSKTEDLSWPEHDDPRRSSWWQAEVSSDDDQL